MIKKKAKSKTATKKPAKKRSSKEKNELSPAEVRKEIAQMVDSEATKMAQAVIDEGMKGQLATVKYLFEVAKIFPEATDGSQTSTDEDCLARTLLNRLDLPDEPIARDEEDAPKPAAEKPAAKADESSDEDEGKDSGSKPEAVDENKNSTPV